MNKDEKRKKADELHQNLTKARTVILSRFEGLSVAADTVLRRKVAETGAGYEVVKNSLIERAAQGTKVEVIAQKLRGTTSVAYSTADPVALARVLTSYAKEYPALVIKAGLVEGRIVSLEEFDSIATLPSREALFARALYLVRAPAQQLVVTLSGVARNLARVIQQGIQEKKFNEVAGN